VQQEGAAADAARLRLDERQHHLRGYRSVDGAAPRLQHLGRGVGGVWVGSCGHPGG
jgi:hypothetical protein